MIRAHCVSLANGNWAVEAEPHLAWVRLWTGAYEQQLTRVGLLPWIAQQREAGAVEWPCAVAPLQK